MRTASVLKENGLFVRVILSFISDHIRLTIHRSIRLYQTGTRPYQTSIRPYQIYRNSFIDFSLQSKALTGPGAMSFVDFPPFSEMAREKYSRQRGYIFSRSVAFFSHPDRPAKV